MPEKSVMTSIGTNANRTAMLISSLFFSSSSLCLQWGHSPHALGASISIWMVSASAL